MHTVCFTAVCRHVSLLFLLKLEKNKETLWIKGTHKHTEASTITDVLLNPKRVNVCQHTVKMTPRYCVFTYIPGLLIEKDICDCQNISVTVLCVHVCLSAGDLFIFLVRVSSLFSYFCVICTSVRSLSMCSPFLPYLAIFWSDKISGIYQLNCKDCEKINT